MLSFMSPSSVRAGPHRASLVLAVDVRKDLYYSSLDLLKHTTALSQKAAFQKLFMVCFSCVLQSIGLKKS